LDLFDKISAILAAPVVGNLDIGHLFLLVGVLLVFFTVWVLILHFIATTAEAAV